MNLRSAIMRRYTGYLVICLLISISPAIGQTFQTTPLSGTNTTGSYYHHTSITLSDGFSTAPGGTFHAYISSAANCLALGTAPSTNKNYVLTYTVKEAGISNPATTSLTSCQVNPLIQYFDVLGRPLQTVQVKGSPGLKDIVQHMEYDAYGRESKKYLPYAESSSADGSFKSSALSNLNSFYNTPPTGVVQIPAVSSITPAYAQTIYELSPLNRVLESGFPGAAWQPSSSGISGSGHTVQSAYGTITASTIRLWNVTSGGADGTGYYGANQLTTTTITDENGSRTIEYKDKNGRVVLKQSEYATNTFINTYYVYDEFGNLKYVIPPGFTATSFNESDTAFGYYIYAYHYDGDKRVIEKKIPGKGWEEMVYNKLDQLVLSRDAVQAGNSKWLFTKYDVLGRPIITGIFSSSSSRSSWQSTIDGQSTLWESRDNTNSSGAGTGYTNATYPTSNIDQYHTVNYYDDYSFHLNGFSPSGTVSDQTRGLLTGTKVNVLGGSTMLLTTNYYDNEGRLKESKSDNHLGGTDHVVNTWNFAGELTASTRTHSANSVTTTIANRWEYDHMGRKLNTFQTMNSDTEVHLSAQHYNEIGQLSNKKLHNNLQSTLFTYNPRGWLKTSDASQFAMELKYEDGTTPQYNGNITNQVFTNYTSNTFTYGYDMLNRLTSGSATGMAEALTYDNMGNIESLNRDGAGASTYSYTGNRLTSISGSSVATATNYVYDNNGNAITDGRNNKTISYNILNLPYEVAGVPTYTYDATGNKLTRAGSPTRHYIRGIEYSGSAIEIIHTEEGLARRSGSSYSYEYNLKDHLGNTRVTLYRNPSSGNIEVLQRDDYYPFGKRYSTVAGSNDNKYLYNGKELQDDLGQYDYGARFYDPVVGRWNVVDPLAENHHGVNPYNYTLNNPLLYTDPLGLDTLDFNSLARVKAGDDINMGNGRFIKMAGDEVRIVGSKSLVDEAKEGVEKAGNWVQDHFEISAGYELSFGAQIGGAVKKGVGGYIDMGSTIHSDVRLSNKGSTGNKYRPGEKTTSGFAAAYFAGVDYEKQSYKGQTTRKASLGAFGVGLEITWDKNGVTDWFGGFNPAFKGGFGFGVEADLKIGFSK